MFKKPMIETIAAMVLWYATTVVQATTLYQWTGVADSNWANSANWASGNIPPAAAGDSRIYVYGTNSANYTAAQGTLVLNSAGRCLTIGENTSAAGTNGSMVISGGTVVSANTQGANYSDFVGYGTTVASLTIVGGTYICTNTAANGFGMLMLGDAGTSATQTTLNINSGLAWIDRIDFSGSATDTGTNTLNLNGGVLMNYKMEENYANAPATATSILSFNGGTLRATRTINPWFVYLDLVNVLTNGAIIDSSNLVVGITQPLLHGSGLAADGGLVKLGSGTLTLSGTNTYTGATTISAGTLALTGAGSLASTLVSMTNGAIFDVSGLTNTFNLQSGQTLSNSAASTGLLKGSLLATNGTISVSYTNGTPVFAVTNGTLTLASNTVFTLNNTGPALATGSYLIISADLAGTVTTNATGLPAVTTTGMQGVAALAIANGQLYLDVNVGNAASVTVYPGLPGNLYQSSVYAVTVSQSNVNYTSYVYYSTNDFNNATTVSFMSLTNHWTSFSFSGTVQVKITLPLRTSITNATVHPLIQNVPAVISSNTVTLTITNPGPYYVQIDNEQRNPIFIFANPPEVNVPSPGSSNTIYFAPGVYNIGTTNIASGNTVYLAGGAYVMGRIYASGPAGAITVRGRGILSGINLGNRGQFSQYMIDGTSGWVGTPNITVNVEGITITDPPGPHIVVFPGNAIVNNVKFMSWWPSTDGVEGYPGTVVSNCFFKVMDDNIHFDQDNVQAYNNVVWLQMSGSVIQMGWGVTASIYNGLVSNLDLIANDWGAWTGESDGSFYNRGLVTLMNMGNTNVVDPPLYVVESGLTMENVRVETLPLQLFSVKIKGNPADGFPEYVMGYGAVSNLTFRNISVAQKPNVRSGFNGNGSYAGNISGVTFDNLTIGGTLVTATNATNYLFQLGATSNFYYTNSSVALLTGLANPTNAGSVAGDGSYSIGSTNLLTATASSGWGFAGWNDGVTNNPRSIIVPANGGSYTANFSSLTIPSITIPGIYSNQFSFSMSGALNQTVVVEACTNLAAPAWLPLETNTFIGIPASFKILISPQQPGCYFRLRNQ